MEEIESGCKNPFVKAMGKLFGCTRLFPPLEKVLKDVTFEQAIWKPADETMNSIWELVCHLLFYEKRHLLRFLCETENEPQAEKNEDTNLEFQQKRLKIGKKQ
ncbi:hypothetical protein [Bacillus sp. AFS088145]|uniref:hypothetical protein n=1 Tax=Bacillus sp. AFS088145 TaxID=2033514 RepID=UPI0025706964|nr:hypothetical protein [Bacillus sp. AFS088145]